MQLSELKKAFDMHRLNLATCKVLIEKREIKLQKIQELKENLENNLIHLHSPSKGKQKQEESIRAEITQISEQIALLKEELKQIDHKIDLMGEENEETLIALKAALIDSIQTQYPNSASEYLQLKEELNKATTKKEILLKRKNDLTPFFEILSEGAQIQLKQSLLNRFMGTNPKALLAKKIKKAAEQAEILRKKQQDPTLNAFLDKFLYESEKNWNRELYKDKYSKLFMEFSTLISSLEQEITGISRQILKIEDAIEIWIEKHCRT